MIPLQPVEAKNGSYPEWFPSPNVRLEQRQYAHRDSLGRPLLEDRGCEQTLKPSSRRLVDLVVQCVDYSYRPRSDPWRRVAVENRAPAIIRLAEWGLARKRVGDRIEADTAEAVARWLPACIALLFVVGHHRKIPLCLLKPNVSTTDARSR